MPLDYMLQTLRDSTADPKDRQWASNAAAPYVHRKLAEVELGNLNGEPLKVALEAGYKGVL